MISRPIPYLFVYGTLRKGFSNGSFNYIDPYISLEGTASVKGDCYRYKDVPALILGKSGQEIEGALFRIIEPESTSWVLMQLDDLKGMRPDNSDTPLYKRSVAIVTYNGFEIESWIYLFNGDITNLPRLESADIPALLNI